MLHLSKIDLDFIQTCLVEKEWRGAEICRQFPGRKWNARQVNRAIKTFENTGSITRKPGSGRPKTARTQENSDDCVHLSLSQDDTPGTHISHSGILFAD